ncbi:MAG: hypothetical protein QOE70_3617 [Chthoniobacter sp.]|jgi:hypothetical protein|nr:hypothetical protein [Chthoniobacter sp.]
MKSFRLFLALLLTITAACDRRPQAADQDADRRRDEQRQADERRLAELRDLEQRAADREAAAVAAQNQAERQKIEAERAALERDRANLTEAQRQAEDQRIALLQEKQDRVEAERRAEAQRRAEDRAEEQRLAEQKASAERGAREARAEQKLDFFYTALDPYGDWFEIEKYGYVWQPGEAANPRWRPYTDGNWAWTEYGWTWASNEKFGWAAYHYGRWTRLKRIGWVWVPGSEWAPAWVAWRRSNDFVGWAPLPAEAHSSSGFNAAVDSYYDIGPGSYTFVPVEEFSAPTYVGRAVEPERNVTIINQTTNITNLSYRKIENTNVFYNAGPEIKVIEARSQAPVKRFTVERMEDTRAAGPAVRKGNVLQMLAPFVAAAARPATAPKKVKERVNSSEMERGWNAAADPQAAQQIRTKFTDEAQAAERAQRAAPRALPAVPVATPLPARAPVAKVAPLLATPVPAKAPVPQVPPPPVAPAKQDPLAAAEEQRLLEEQQKLAAKKRAEAFAARAAQKRGEEAPAVPAERPPPIPPPAPPNRVRKTPLESAPPPASIVIPPATPIAIPPAATPRGAQKPAAPPKAKKGLPDEEAPATPPAKDKNRRVPE